MDDREDQIAELLQLSLEKASQKTAYHQGLESGLKFAIRVLSSDSKIPLSDQDTSLPVLENSAERNDVQGPVLKALRALEQATVTEILRWNIARGIHLERPAVARVLKRLKDSNVVVSNHHNYIIAKGTDL